MSQPQNNHSGDFEYDEMTINLLVEALREHTQSQIPESDVTAVVPPLLATDFPTMSEYNFELDSASTSTDGDSVHTYSYSDYPTSFISDDLSDRSASAYPSFFISEDFSSGSESVHSSMVDTTDFLTPPTFTFPPYSWDYILAPPADNGTIDPCLLPGVLHTSLRLRRRRAMGTAYPSCRRREGMANRAWDMVLMVRRYASPPPHSQSRPTTSQALTTTRPPSPSTGTSSVPQSQSATTELSDQLEVGTEFDTLGSYPQVVVDQSGVGVGMEAVEAEEC